MKEKIKISTEKGTPTIKDYEAAKKEAEDLKNQVVDFLKNLSFKNIIELYPDIDMNYRNEDWRNLKARLKDEWGKLKENTKWQPVGTANNNLKTAARPF